MNKDLKLLISSNIRIARERKKMTQAELAEALGVTSASVSSYEKGGSVPSLPVIYKISSILGVSIDWLCGKNTENEPETYADVIRILISLLGLKDLDPHLERGGVMFTDDTIVKFCMDYREINRLYEAGTFTDEMYKLVIDALLNKDEYQWPFLKF